MYKIKFFTMISTSTYSESKARVLFQNLVKTYGIKNVKLIYIGEWVIWKVFYWD